MCGVCAHLEVAQNTAGSANPREKGKLWKAKEAGPRADDHAASETSRDGHVDAAAQEVNPVPACFAYRPS
jgi:hypothetical protein